MRVQSFLRMARRAVTIAGLVLLIGSIEVAVMVTLVDVATAVGAAAAQAGKPVPKVSPQFASSITTMTTFVQVGTLQWGQTVDRPIPFNPRPTKGVMSVSGTWSQAVMGVEGGLGHVSLKVTVKSPSGTIVARGCGYSLDSNLRPALVLHAIGMTVSPEAPVQWTVSVEGCGQSEPLTAISNVRIRIDY